jgi:hypothetical protein
MAQFESLENFVEIIENEGPTAVDQQEETNELQEEVDGDEDAEEAETNENEAEEETEA